MLLLNLEWAVVVVLQHLLHLMILVLVFLRLVVKIKFFLNVILIILAQSNTRGRRKTAVSANFETIQQMQNLQNSDVFLNNRNAALTSVNNNTIQNLMQQQQQKKTARVNNFVNR